MDKVKATSKSRESDIMDCHNGTDACDSGYSKFDVALSVDCYNENEFEDGICQDEGGIK